MNFQNFFYAPMQVIVEFPVIAFLCAGFFYFLTFRKRKMAILLVADIWLIYGGWESCMWFWSQKVIAPIRVDLFVITPILYFASAVGFFYFFRR